MKFFFVLFWIFLSDCTALGEFTNLHCESGTKVIVQLFEWTWSSIARECPFLAEAGYCAVQIPLPTENEIQTIPERTWWERYLPVSYKIHTRSGNESQFLEMTTACEKSGIRIIADVVFNVMSPGEGKGVAGTSYNGFDKDYPGVPYNASHFYNLEKCFEVLQETPEGYNEALRKCDAIPDLDQSQPYVRGKIVELLDHLIDLGVMGFHINSAKHMYPEDLKAVYKAVKNNQFDERPFIINEVVDTLPDRVSSQEYLDLDLGYLTEFHYSRRLAKALKKNLLELCDIFTPLFPPERALIFVDNQAVQRGKFITGNYLSHKDAQLYKMAQAFTLATDYGMPRVMSSYYFTDTQAGPPHDRNYNILEVSINANGTCDNDWVCEHRWPVIQQMIKFNQRVRYQRMHHCVSTQDTISFLMGADNFFWMTTGLFQPQEVDTGLPPGHYCDIITNCTDEYTVDTLGKTVFVDTGEPIKAFVHKELQPSSGNVLSGTRTSTVPSATGTKEFKTHTITTINTLTSTEVNINAASKTIKARSPTTLTRTPTTLTRSSTTVTKPPTTLTRIPTTSPTTTTTTLTALAKITSTTTSATTTPAASTTTVMTTTSTTTTGKTTCAQSRTLPWKRTVIFVERATGTGQNVFLRGGIDAGHRRGCLTSEFSSNHCAIPIRHRCLNMTFSSPARDAWARGDNYLDWYGAEPRQGTYYSVAAHGSPGQWTTDDIGGKYYSSLNTFGANYWLFDVDMDCSRTEKDFFEFKVYLNGWESSSNLQAGCTDDGGTQIHHSSNNPIGKCGYMNVYHWNQPACEIRSLPSV